MTAGKRLCPNVSVSLYPIEILPIIFRYGYAMPFYNVSNTVRAVVFNTKNQSKLASMRKRIVLSSAHVSSWTQLWRTICVDCGFVHHSADLRVVRSTQTGSGLASVAGKGGLMKKR